MESQEQKRLRLKRCSLGKNFKRTRESLTVIHHGLRSGGGVALLVNGKEETATARLATPDQMAYTKWDGAKEQLTK